MRLRLLNVQISPLKPRGTFSALAIFRFWDIWHTHLSVVILETSFRVLTDLRTKANFLERMNLFRLTLHLLATFFSSSNSSIYSLCNTAFNMKQLCNYMNMLFPGFSIGTVWRLGENFSCLHCLIFYCIHYSSLLLAIFALCAPKPGILHVLVSFITPLML